MSEEQVLIEKCYECEGEMYETAIPDLFRCKECGRGKIFMIFGGFHVTMLLPSLSEELLKIEPTFYDEVRMERLQS